MKVNIQNKKMEIKEGILLIDLAKELFEKDYKKYIVAKVDGILKDLTSTTTTKDIKNIEFLDFDNAKSVFWHSSAHLMASAILRLFPDAKLTIGPDIDNGFYYDVYYQNSFTPEDLKKIEKTMKKIAHEGPEFKREEISYKKAKEIFKDNKFKLELIDEHKEKTLSIYTLDKFIDLCKGPHIPNASYIKAFKLTKVSGAYWRASSENEQLQRIYGIAFPDKERLNDYLNWMEEVKKRDHKLIGKQMDLFSFSEYAPGMPFFHNKGMILWNILMNYWNEVHKEDGYELIKTPIMLNKKLWEVSGHWDHYRENMYTTNVDDQDYAIKPMNCPGGILVYKNKLHSYKELPIKSGEIGLVHRHELSGVLSGLFRVRCFHQDDAHIFMRPDQIKDQIIGVLKLVEKVYSKFGINDYHLELSTRPEEGSIGSDENWDLTTKGLKRALDEFGKKYIINEGDGAFYGPKIDVHIKDAIGRTWQCATIQLDMNLPERFDLTYIDENNNRVRPVMIHRVIYGSIERFIGVLIENYAGKFPLWLNPTQIKILPIADRHFEYARDLQKQLLEQGLRVEIDDNSETLNKKVRNAQLEKVNYILVIGDKEIEEDSVNIRTRDNEVLGTMSKNEFFKKINKELN